MDGITLVRFILRAYADGAAFTPIRPDLQPYHYPSYMAAVRGRAMVSERADIIQQELTP